MKALKLNFKFVLPTYIKNIVKQKRLMVNDDNFMPIL